jgi:hypothetical protein
MILAIALAVVICPQPRAHGAAPIGFENVAEQAGLRFVLENHPTPEKHNIETMAGGVAVFDYNNDGRPDIFFTNGAAVPELRKESAKDYNRLFRNEGGLKFTDVTEQAGLTGQGYSSGAAAADYDNDGHVDLFVAGAYHNILYHNRGDGTFEDVTAKAGIRSDKWTVAAGWFDYDKDGLLDLFVVNYMKWTPSFNLYCGDPARQFRIYCHPNDFGGLANNLYRNRGDGTFEDVSDRTGISRYIGRGMSVAFGDYDGDGFPDALVTNDQLPNFLFRNVQGQRFEETGLMAGVALLDNGKPVSSMGVDFRDYDNDGRPDIVITALSGETFPLFHNQGNGTFRDATYASGVGSASARHSGWCAALTDFNNDGYKDIFIAGGHVNDRIAEMEPSRYKEPNLVLLNLGNGKFRDVSASAGQEFAQTPRAHRGCGLADFDGDGLQDVVVTALGDPPELWHNVTKITARWVDVDLRGTASNRDGIGATIRIGNQYQIRTSAAGYASSSLVPVHFGGIGANDQIEIRWPSGKLQRIPVSKVNGIQVVTEPK